MLLLLLFLLLLFLLLLTEAFLLLLCHDTGVLAVAVSLFLDTLIIAGCELRILVGLQIFSKLFCFAFGRKDLQVLI